MTTIEKLKFKKKKSKLLKGKAKRKFRRKIIIENRMARREGFRGTLD